MSPGRIPIQNIYFLLCYAWNHLQEVQYADVRATSCDKAWDLMAKVLVRGTQQLVKRGLHRDYVSAEERRTQLKGKILFAETLKRPSVGSLAQLCEFDELSIDVLPNRIIRSTLARLHKHPELPGGIRAELRDVIGYFDTVTPLRIENRTFRHLQLHRNMRHYRFVLDVCEFIHHQSLPTHTEGESRFRDFTQDEACMGALFERFVRNFFTKEQCAYAVSAPQVDWHVDKRLSTAGGLDLLPTMQTDIALQSPSDRLIVDCKFYSDAFQQRFDRRKFISGNLYQILAYVRNQARHPGWENVRGMLLYPTVDHAFDETIHLEGHPIRVVAINLNQNWQLISRGLLALLPLTNEANE